MARSVAAAPSRLNRKFLVVAVLLATLSATLIYAGLSSSRGGSKGSPATGTQPVVVAKSAIKQRTTITRDMLDVKSISQDAVLAGTFGSIDEVVGQVTKFPIEPNQQVVSTAVIDTTKPTSEAALSLVVPAGKRAVSIKASQVISAGGLILPGDYVDVIWACCADKPVVAKTLLRNIQVAAVAQTIVNSGPVAGAPGKDTGSTAPVAADTGKAVPDAVTMTLLLSPDEAQQVFLAEGNGDLRADLRGVNDSETPDPGAIVLTQLLPPALVAGLPDALKPDGYKVTP